MDDKKLKFGTTPYWNKRWGEKRKINISFEGNWEDIDMLIAFFKHWQGCGGVGHTASVNFLMDCDGTSHPKIEVDGKKVYDFPNKFWKINSKDKFEKLNGWDEIKDD